jgi:hypothetical protein
MENYNFFAILFIIWEILILTGLSNNFIKSFKDDFKPFSILSILSWFFILISYTIWGIAGCFKVVSGDSSPYFISLVLVSFLTMFIFKEKDMKKKADAVCSIIILFLILIS